MQFDQDGHPHGKLLEAHTGSESSPQKPRHAGSMWLHNKNTPHLNSVPTSQRVCPSTSPSKASQGGRRDYLFRLK